VTPRNFWADGSPKSGVAPTRFSLFFPVTFPFVVSLIPLLFWQLPASWREEIREAKSAVSNSYLLHWFRPDSRCSPRHNTPPFAACFLLLGWRGPPRIPWHEVRSPPRISVGNGFTRPTGDINVNYSPYTQRPSSKENLNENLLRLAIFPAGTSPPGGSLQQFHGVGLRTRRSPSRSANSDRSTLKESNPYLLRGLEKGKPQSESLVFFGKLAKPRGSHRRLGSSLNWACRSKMRSTPCSSQTLPS
jgi:hypothetical protein